MRARPQPCKAATAWRHPAACHEHRRAQNLSVPLHSPPSQVVQRRRQGVRIHANEGVATNRLSVRAQLNQLTQRARAPCPSLGVRWCSRGHCATSRLRLGPCGPRKSTGFPFRISRFSITANFPIIVIFLVGHTQWRDLGAWVVTSREGHVTHEPNTPPPKCEGDMEEQHQRCCCAHGRSCRVRRACRGLRTSLRQPRDGGSVATKSHTERWRSCKLSRGAAEPDCRGVCAARASDGGERRAAVCRQPLGYRDYKLQRMVCYCQAGV